MKYYINPIWFYFMGLCDDVKALTVIIVMFSWMIALCLYLINEMRSEDDKKNYPIKKLVTLGTVSLILATITPTSATVKEMMIASVVTYDNVETAKEDVKSLIDYAIDKIDELND